MNVQSNIKNTRLIDATFADLETFLETFLNNHPINDKPSQKKFVRGLAGIMEIFNCKKTKASKLKNTIIADAVHEQDGLILTDSEKALELFANYNAKRRVKR